MGLEPLVMMSSVTPEAICPAVSVNLSSPSTLASAMLHGQVDAGRRPS